MKQPVHAPLKISDTGYMNLPFINVTLKQKNLKAIGLDSGEIEEF